MFADVHCHLDHAQLKHQLDALLQRARDAKLGFIVTCGVTPASNDEALIIAARHPDIVRCSLGCYPLDAVGVDIDTEGKVRHARPFDVDAELARWHGLKDRFVAVGEAGLDFKWTKDEPTVKAQKVVFEKVIATAEHLHKPIVIHSRSAELECIEMLETSRCKNVILHSFGGRKALMRRAIDNGWNFSIPPVITRLEHFRLLADLAPLEQLLTETDAPYLGPKAGETNEPKNVTITVNEIAGIKKVEAIEVEEHIWRNVKKTFSF